MLHSALYGIWQAWGLDPHTEQALRAGLQVFIGQAIVKVSVS